MKIPRARGARGRRRESVTQGWEQLGPISAGTSVKGRAIDSRLIDPRVRQGQTARITARGLETGVPRGRMAWLEDFPRARTYLLIKPAIEGTVFARDNARRP